MSGNQDSSEPEPHDGHDRQPPGRDREPDDREPPDDGERIGRAHPPRDDDEDSYEGVTHRPSRLPEREGDEDELTELDEDELAEADMMEMLDLDDLERMDGPDA